MPNRKLSYQVDVDSSDAVRGLRQMGDAGARAGRELADAFDDAESAGTKALAGLAANMERLEADVEGTARAVKAIGAAAGDGFDSSRVEGFVVDLNRMGVSFDEIEAKAKEFADVMQRADAIKLDAASQGLTRVGAGLDRVADAGDQSRSVLANLAGNSAQSLGELGGVVGDLGVGIGQLVEYAVDGNIAMSNLAKVAGPMAGLAAAGLLVSKVFGDMAKVKAFDAERSDALTDALAEQGDVWANLREQIAETGELMTSTAGPFGGAFLGNVDDVLPKLQKLGFTFEDFQTLVTDPAALAALKEYREGVGNPQQRSDLQQVIYAVEDYQGAIEGAADAQRALQEFLGGPSTVEGVTSALEQQRSVVESTNAAWAALLADMADDGVVDNVTRYDSLRRTLGLTETAMTELTNEKFADRLEEQADAAAELDEAMADAAGAVDEFNASADDAGARADAFAEGLDAINAASETSLAGRIIAASDALDGFGQTLSDAAAAGVDFAGTDWIPDNWDEVRNMPDELRPVVEAFAGMRDQIQNQLTTAFETGGMPAFERELGNIRVAIINELSAAGIEGTEALNQAFEALGIDRPTIDVLIKATVDAQARQALDGLRGIIDGLVQGGVIDAQVALDIATLSITDPQAALADAQAALEDAGFEVTLPAELELDEAERQARGFTNTRRTAVIDAEPGASVAETGGELDDVAADRTAQINTSFVQQLVQGLILGAYLDYVARPRTVSIGVEVTGLAAANQLIDYAARDRSATIDVDAQTFALQRAIATAIANAVRLGRVAG